MRDVPFLIGDGLDDDSMLRGRVGFGGASVTLELATDAEGRRLAAPRKVVIGVEELAGCKFRRGLLADRLHLRTASVATFGGVPGAHLDVITLQFSKRDRGAAQALAGRLSSAVVERPPVPLASNIKVLRV